MILPSSKSIGAVLRYYVKAGPSFGDRVEIDRAVNIDLMLNDFPPQFTDHTVKLSAN